ncbi:MAG: MFS transporter [Rhizobiales bacterium]|nr:MFS transporter [Hyphomicrobiales bacterium]
MPSRWTILAVLFAARAAMAFQFQSVAAIAPQLSQGLGASLADIGILIGLYFAPGTVLALPGGAIGRRLGDKTAVLAGLAMMLAGQWLMTASTGWDAQIAGRLMAGAGGIVLNVVMTKMVADWFSGPEMATAMAIFVNSWPVGIAVALMALPAIATGFGLGAANWAVMAPIAVGIVLVAWLYRAPDMPAAGPGGGRLSPGAAAAVIAAGVIWGLYNLGLAMVFSFGPSMLAARGWSASAAGSTISIVLWLATLSVPLGGVLADRSKRGDLILVDGCIAFAVLLLLLSRSGTVLPVVLVLGAICGLPAGAIMSLPQRVLGPDNRAIGMGLFYTVFYAGMLLGPMAGGRIAVWAGNAGAALDFGAAALLACPIMFWLFRLIPGGMARPAAART